MDTKDTEKVLCLRDGLKTVPYKKYGLFLCVLGVLCVESTVTRAQFQMPDMKEMSGIPRPVDDLPKGAISVRLIRGALSNNISGHPVELHVGTNVRTQQTDESGRAQFNDVTPGSTVKAVAVVDGERLESQEFPAPAQGGIRLMLVATDPSQRPAPNAPPIAGPVVIANESRIVLEPSDEAVRLFYLLDIANNATAPVNPPAPFAFDMPSDAVGTTIMQGSSPLAIVKGIHVSVQGPFPPGHTYVQVACELPGGSGSIDLAQKFPATFEQLAIVVRKVGATTLISRQVQNQREIPADGQTYIAATGGAVPAGQPIEVSISGFPHHSGAPRVVALSLAGLILLIGVWAATRTEDDTQSHSAERKRLLARRDKLFTDLVRLENDHRNGLVDDRRYASKREDLVAALEHVYGALDTHDTGGPGPADRAGLAA